MMNPQSGSAYAAAASRILDETRTQSAGILLALVYLATHIWLFWARPKRFLDIEVALQLLLLAAVFVGFKGQKDSEREGMQIPRWLLAIVVAAFSSRRTGGESGLHGGPAHRGR